MRLSLAVSDLYPSCTTLDIDPLHKERNEAPMLHPQPVIGMYMICNLHTQARDVGQTVYLSASVLKRTTNLPSAFASSAFRTAVS
jgi:hypothetical protein